MRMATQEYIVLPMLKKLEMSFIAAPEGEASYRSQPGYPQASGIRRVAYGG